MASYKANYATKILKDNFLKDPENFKENAEKLLKTFNRWEAIEHNTIVAQARTAKQFIQFQKEKHLYPNIEWLRTRSVNPDEVHLSFVGLILPQDHPFWQNNYPGNRYGCKCDMKTTDEAVNDKGINLEINTSANGLEANPINSGELFTDKHPYFAKAKEPQKAQENFTEDSLPNIRKNVFEWAKLNLSNITVDKVQKLGTIEFTNKGLKEAINQPHKDIINKNMALFNIKEILPNAEYLYSMPDTNKSGNIFHYMSFVLKGKTSYLIIKETVKDKIKRLYSITDSIKK